MRHQRSSRRWYLTARQQDPYQRPTKIIVASACVWPVQRDVPRLI
jgi:hypothetical protein